MGDPKFARPKTRTPTHPWKQARIEEEHALKERFGLKKVGGMREIWREKSERQQLQIGAQGRACMWHLAVEASEPLIVATVAAKRPELCG